MCWNQKVIEACTRYKIISAKRFQLRFPTRMGETPEAIAQETCVMRNIVLGTEKDISRYSKLILTDQNDIIYKCRKRHKKWTRKKYDSECEMESGNY